LEKDKTSITSIPDNGSGRGVPPSLLAPTKGPMELVSGKVMIAMATVRNSLAGLSFKETKEVLAAVAAIHNLRVISMDRPIGYPNDNAPPPKGASVPGKRNNNKPQKVGIKSNEEYKNLEAQRKDIVRKLQAIKDDTPEKESLLQNLKELNLSVKALKNKNRDHSNGQTQQNTAEASVEDVSTPPPQGVAGSA